MISRLILSGVLVATGAVRGLAASCTAYQASGPVVVQRDGQVIDNLVITSTNGPAIVVQGYSGVVIRNVVVHHNGGPGIQLASAAGLTVTNADIVFDGAPPAGANPNAGDNNIDCYGSSGLTVHNVRLTRGSSGIYLNRCPNSALSMIEGHDQRGPFPRGQLVQWDNSNHGSLSDFSDENSLDDSWTEDNVNVYQASGIVIRHGLLDTNNSPSGDGVIADNKASHVTVEDVDAIHQGNGCFGIYGGGESNVTFTHTRCRDNYCALPRGKPLSGSLAWAIDPAARKGDLNLQASQYYNLCNPENIVYLAKKLTIDKVREVDFTARAPLRVTLCEYGY